MALHDNHGRRGVRHRLTAQEAFAVSIFGTTPLKFSSGILHPEDLKAFALMKEYDHKSIAIMLKLIRKLPPKVSAPPDPRYPTVREQVW
jgi:hypothetical protein